MTTLRRRLVVAGALLLPILELAVLIRVGSLVGAGTTVLLLLAGAVAGTLVLRGVGTDAVRRLGAPGARGPAGVVTPGRPPAETALVVLAGLLLLVPGFLSDAAGLLLLVPPVRRAVVRRTGEAVLRRLRAQQARVVQGEVVDVRVIEPEPGTRDPR